ncbi:AAA family ATPase [Sulfurisphaera tokodaii]|uniref:ATPase AAA-type core domain-containing protein n=2 Tax=Sulfurisphaera tokodaii TaxID=111955 RepID=Q96Z91_SULTO|nr:AAA family ATPase [Sulfurisphaera tokodaii]BAB67035.1 hypothetical protein STK_19410 [Sulfurisphaera tokodaii str. 7]HII74474.1 AAA family ATPase [Sulfurisphaera tokodaii]
MIQWIRVKNFKSFDDLRIDLHKVNVLVGPNGAGKSNFVDVFLFLREFIRPSSLPPYPFLYWGGYKNLVYMNDESLNVEIEVQGDNYHYRTVINGKDGLRVLEEELEHQGVKISRRYNEVYVDDKKYEIDPSLSIFHTVQRIGPMTLSSFPIPPQLLDLLTKLGSDFVVLRINPYTALSPVPFNSPYGIRIDGFGLPRLLNDLPKPIQEFLTELNMAIKVDVSPEGNFVMYILERVGNREVFLHSSAIPSGVVKMIAIMTVIYKLKPSLLVIDEVENSLHLNFLERLTDVFEYSEPQIIVTTHSPMVIDLVKVEDVIMVEKEGGRSIMKRISNVKELKKELSEKGLLLSEYLFYS